MRSEFVSEAVDKNEQSCTILNSLLMTRWRSMYFAPRKTPPSPYLNQFTQPDGIVPDPYNPQDWNRYSYVRNNPLKYNDPTGHKPMCEEDPASCKKLTPAEELKAKIKDQYNWDIKGSFTLKELKTIYQTGQDIETYVDGISGGKGQEWMLRMLGNTTIEHGYFDDGHSDAWPFLGNNFESRIRLNENWLNDGWGAKVVFAHELGHIYDINSSFAASYLINLDMGGEGVDLFSPPGSQVPRWASDYHDGYGNSGRNEYFAEAFSATIYDRSNAPTGVAEWIDSKFSNLLYFNPWVRP